MYAKVFEKQRDSGLNLTLAVAGVYNLLKVNRIENLYESFTTNLAQKYCMLLKEVDYKEKPRFARDIVSSLKVVLSDKHSKAALAAVVKHHIVGVVLAYKAGVEHALDIFTAVLQ
jgi:hypothetical protein